MAKDRHQRTALALTTESLYSRLVQLVGDNRAKRFLAGVRRGELRFWQEAIWRRLAIQELLDGTAEPSEIARLLDGGTLLSDEPPSEDRTQAVLARLGAMLAEGRFSEVEVEAARHCRTEHGPAASDRIASIDLGEYEHQLHAALERAHASLSEEIRAVYFEYDMSNDWQGHVFLCSEYLPPEDDAEDWACEFDLVLPGPDLPSFAEADRALASGFDSATVFLVARTSSAFGRAASLSDAWPVPVCVAFHDQEPIFRVGTRMGSQKKVAKKKVAKKKVAKKKVAKKKVAKKKVAKKKVAKKKRR